MLRRHKDKSATASSTSSARSLPKAPTRKSPPTRRAKPINSRVAGASQQTASSKTRQSNMIEIIPEKLYYTWCDGVPTGEGVVPFTIDNKLIYRPFAFDFGPHNLSSVYKFSAQLKKLLQTLDDNQHVLFYSSSDAKHRSNAVTLLGIFSVLFMGMTPEEAYEPFVGLSPPLVPFRDASRRASTFDLTPYDCIEGAYCGMVHRFFDFSTFSTLEYDFYECVENGDFNWVVEGKFLAFAGPHRVHHIDNGYTHFCPEDFHDYFRMHNVTDIVRLNDPMYDASQFTKAGFKHHDLIYRDGTTPPHEILDRFLAICEQAEGGIAVHCKAGLGRTGSLIGAYLMRHYGLTARQVIAWLRLARPGSVVGCQQDWLVRIREYVTSGIQPQQPLSSPAWASSEWLNEVLPERLRRREDATAFPRHAAAASPGAGRKTLKATATSGEEPSSPKIRPDLSSEAFLYETDENSPDGVAQGDFLIDSKARAQHSAGRTAMSALSPAAPPVSDEIKTPNKVEMKADERNRQAPRKLELDS